MSLKLVKFLLGGTILSAVFSFAILIMTVIHHFKMKSLVKDAANTTDQPTYKML